MKHLMMHEEEKWNGNFPDPEFIIDSIIAGMIESGDMEKIIESFNNRNGKKIRGF